MLDREIKALECHGEGVDMAATDGSDDFAEMLERYARAMNRLVNGDPEPIKALYSKGPGSA